MAGADPWSTIHAERKALAADLDSLPDDQWATPSLCPDWTVRDVLAHMTATAKITAGSFFPKLIAAGFSLKTMQKKDIVRERGSSPGDTLARFKAEVDSSSHPPGPGDTWLGEVVIHSQDIRRPLGIKHEYPTDALTRVADFYKNSNMVIGTKRRIEGVTLRATDTDWTHGAGPEVSGPMLSILMTMTGRQAALADLSGEGVAVLQGRS
jgi:uncharacterized protein (TIGR03083 family)